MVFGQPEFAVDRNVGHERRHTRVQCLEDDEAETLHLGWMDEQRCAGIDRRERFAAVIADEMDAGSRGRAQALLVSRRGGRRADDHERLDVRAGGRVRGDQIVESLGLVDPANDDGIISAHESERLEKCVGCVECVRWRLDAVADRDGAVPGVRIAREELRLQRRADANDAVGETRRQLLAEPQRRARGPAPFRSHEISRMVRDDDLEAEHPRQRREQGRTDAVNVDDMRADADGGVEQRQARMDQRFEPAGTRRPKRANIDTAKLRGAGGHVAAARQDLDIEVVIFGGQ